MMLLTHNPFAEIQKVQRQFDQMLTEMINPPVPDWTPEIEAQETSDAFIIRVIAPNLETESLDIQVSKQAIAICGKTQRTELPEGAKYLYSEFPVGQFRQVLSLRDTIVNTEVKANYANGILTVTLPKASETKNRVVKVNLTETHQSEPLETAEAGHQ
ncbi:MAG: Hsp20/alpha crystallin family protein [Microcoleaceae cyanobacterium]